ncbi:MAG: hypothetical protein WB816_11400 [Methylocystis sp.]
MPKPSEIPAVDLDRSVRPSAAPPRFISAGDGRSMAPSAPRARLARPPCVTAGQLLRVGLLVAGAALYLNQPPSGSGSRSHEGQSVAAVDGSPTASIVESPSTEQGQGR